MQVPRDGKEPRTELRIRIETVRMSNEPEPRFLEQLLGDLAASGQPREESEQPRVEHRENRVERRLVTCTDSPDERQLGLTVHARYNA